MRVTHLGHACLLVEIADTRILIDPGSFSTGFEEVRDLDAIVVTHQHADHLDQDRLPALIKANRQAAVYADPQSAGLIAGAGADVVTTVAGQRVAVGGTVLTPVGALHAINHAGVPRCANVGVTLRAEGEPTLFHPGDAYDGEPGPVDLLAVPVNAPWAKVSESIAFVARIAPVGIIPIHDALLSVPGRAMYVNHIVTYGGADLTLHDLAHGRPTVIT
ncbi:MBL fold metallo-hydrolase [Lapillicoccus sp.]|uniref:MBL fold metallo-hydrolase n=1 Tax=Lapillicoccus sp. TaxID=1909287 RepID=UPI0025E727C7|nr:MBL fold metallo-hydrolase [Lapillicoccus sp.]